MTTRKLLLALPAAALASATLSASAAVTFTEVARFDTFQSASAAPGGAGLNAEYVGGLAAVAWDGSRLFIAGIEGNGSAGVATPGIVEILNAAGATGFKFVNGQQQSATVLPTDIQFGTPFGQNVAGAFQGYFGLDLSADGILVGNFDFGGAGSGFGDDLKIFNVAGASPTRLDDPNTDDGARFAAGPGIDPGFQGNGVNAGPAAIVFSNTNGRQLYSDVDGSIVVPFASGHRVTPDFDADGNPGSQGGSDTRESTLHRDLEYAANGDAYIRAANTVRFVNRTGDETALPAVNIFDTNPNGFFSSVQNVEYAEIAGANDLLIFNNRPNNTVNKTFLDTIKVTDALGNLVAASFDFLDDPNTLADAVPGINGGAFDFDYDPRTQTLAISDFSNNQVYIFQISDSTAGDLNGSGGINALDVDIVSEQIGTTAAAEALATPDDLDSNGVYNYDDVLSLLDVAGALLGDVNFSGNIEQGDLDAVLNNWGALTKKYSEGDYNGSGSVEQGDLDIVLNNWGSSVAPSFEGFAVPEPATAALLGLAGLAMLRRRA